mmetsp:Transcript_18309/g.39384  ORF Transcript_18309/g.39384 Transcript_18309/m.39384 type:complete len:243 (+) Transcript_18309:252-980(+)
MASVLPGTPSRSAGRSKSSRIRRRRNGAPALGSPCAGSRVPAKGACITAIPSSRRYLAGQPCHRPRRHCHRHRHHHRHRHCRHLNRHRRPPPAPPLSSLVPRATNALLATSKSIALWRAKPRCTSLGRTAIPSRARMDLTQIGRLVVTFAPRGRRVVRVEPGSTSILPATPMARQSPTAQRILCRSSRAAPSSSGTPTLTIGRAHLPTFWARTTSVWVASLAVMYSTRSRACLLSLARRGWS